MKATIGHRGARTSCFSPPASGHRPVERRAGARPPIRRRVLLAVAAASAFLPASAQGGTYEVLACDAAPGGLNRAWTARSSSPNLAAYAQCPARGFSPGPGGLITRNSPQNHIAFNLPGTLAAQSFDAPRGASIVGVTWAGYRLHRGDPDGAAYEIGVVDDSLRWLDAHCSGPRWCADRSTRSTVAFERVPRHHVAVPDRRRLAFVTICQGQAGRPCPSGSTGDASSGYLVAGIMATWVRVRVADATRPALTDLAGPLWRNGSLRGGRAVRFRAADNVGIRRVRLLVDGRPRASTASSCDFTRQTPCPSPRRYRLPVDTRLLSDGRHALAIEVTDAAGNTAVAGRTIAVANGEGGEASGGPGFREILIAALFVLGLLLEVLALILLMRKRRRRAARPVPPPAGSHPEPKPDESGDTERAVELSSARLGRGDHEEVRERIAAMRGEGMTLQAIADVLNDAGVPTLRGGAMWRPSGVASAAGYRRPRRSSLAASKREQDADR